MRTWSPASGVYLGRRESGHAVDSNDPDQPLIAASASIYNRQEVAGKLAARGRHLQGEQVQEVLYSAYEQFGKDCFAMLNGDFAVALWDEKAARLILARDCLGARMLYYWHGPDRVAFATEYKALLALPELRARPNLAALQHLQRTKYLPPETTLLQDVKPVPAAHWLEVSRDEIIGHRYWKPEIKLRSISMQAAEQELQTLFLQSVARRLPAAGKVGAELSGGIDSASVVAAMHRARPDQQVKTFSIGAGPDDPEILGARVVAQHLQTDHREIFAGPETLPEVLPRVVWHLEDPIARTETVLYYQMMKDASPDIDVVLGGYASDGLFAGLPRHKLVRLMQVAPVGRRSLEEFYHYTQASTPPQTLLGKAATRLYYGKNELPPPHILGASHGAAPRPLPPKRRGLLNEMLLRGMDSGVASWLPKVEKSHAGAGVQFRSPFLDTDLIRFSLELPEQFKLRGFRDKFILRRALIPLLPKEVVKRPKFPQRMDYNLKLTEVLDAMADEILSPQKIAEHGLFDPTEIAMLRRRDPGKAYGSNRAMQLWTAIATELWAHQFLDMRGDARAVAWQ
jgi:asparagine synthase (glutamine-hydrolysing)